jgi:hypothetical protein
MFKPGIYTIALTYTDLDGQEGERWVTEYLANEIGKQRAGARLVKSREGKMIEGTHEVTYYKLVKCNL